MKAGSGGAACMLACWSYISVGEHQDSHSTEKSLSKTFPEN
jgi:hypothetical protein